MLDAPGEESVDMSDPKVQEMIRSVKDFWGKGMPPQQVADIVFDAIRINQFYGLPNGKELLPRSEPVWKIFSTSVIRPSYLLSLLTFNIIKREEAIPMLVLAYCRPHPRGCCLFPPVCLIFIRNWFMLSLRIAMVSLPARRSL